MLYLTVFSSPQRLGTWGFPSINKFINTIKTAGMGALEVTAMGLKACGLYAARTLSYNGAEFRLTQLQISPALTHQYNRAATMWVLLFKVFNTLKDAGVVIPRRVNSQLWGAHMRFFKALLMSSKVPHLARLATRAVDDGNCVVVGLQSTGEVR